MFNILLCAVAIGLFCFLLAAASTVLSFARFLLYKALGGRKSLRKYLAAEIKETW